MTTLGRAPCKYLYLFVASSDDGKRTDKGLSLTRHVGVESRTRIQEAKMGKEPRRSRLIIVMEKPIWEARARVTSSLEAVHVSSKLQRLLGGPIGTTGVVLLRLRARNRFYLINLLIKIV